MSLFDKWNWIKRNWTYILEEASKQDLVFVGGTALNLAIFKEYRASEDIDLYDPYAHDLSLPMSILWTGSSDYFGTSLNKSGVNMKEFAIKADNWLKEEFPVF